MATMLDNPTVAAVFPVVMLFTGALVAIPPLILHVLLNPMTYVFSSTPVAERVTALRHKLFYYAWSVFSPLLDGGQGAIKTPVLAKCHGTVLEIGAGIGANIKYYDRSKVARLILVEPNMNMHPKLRAAAAASGFTDADGSLLLLGCGGAAADEAALAAAGVGPASVDSAAIIHVLCGIPGPAAAIEMYRRMLKPGGVLAFFEHVRSEQKEAAAIQEWFTKYLWPHAFDGCHLDRPTGEWIVRGPAGGAANGTSQSVSIPARKRMVDGEEEGVVKDRWREYHVNVPEGQAKYTTLPQIYGYAIKA